MDVLILASRQCTWI